MFDFSKPIINGKSGGAVVIYGDPGIGKSTFLANFQAELGNSVTTIICQTDQILRQAFNPFITSLRNHFYQEEDAADLENKAAFLKQWQQLNDTLYTFGAPPRLSEEFQRTQSMLGALFGLHWEGSLYEQLGGELRYQNTLTAVKTWLFAESYRKPVVLILEDAQWLDEASQAVVTSLSQELNEHAFLEIITSRYKDNGRRPEFNLADNTRLLILALKPLSTSALRKQVEQILDGPVNDTILLAKSAESSSKGNKL